MARVSGNGREENGFGALVPKGELGFACAEEIGDGLIVVLGGAAFLDEVSFPGNFGIEVREWIFPPPDFVALPIAAENDVGMAVAIDIANDAAGLDGEVVGFYDITIPAVRGAAIPDEGGGGLAKAEDEIVFAVFIEIAGDAAGLLGGGAGERKIAVGGGEMRPMEIGGVSGDGDEENRDAVNKIFWESHFGGTIRF